MGTDIHFVVERKRRDGTWEAVYSKAYAYFQSFSETGMFRAPGHDDPAGIAIAISSADYDIFSVLSRVRCDEEGVCLMRAGHPEDRSHHVSVSYDEDGFLHSLGYATLDDMRRRLHDHDPETGESIYAYAEGTPASDDLLERVSSLIDLIRRLAEKADEAKILLHGREYDSERDIRYPDMTESNHSRLAATSRARRLYSGFLPLSESTVRWIIAYDN